MITDAKMVSFVAGIWVSVCATEYGRNEISSLWLWLLIGSVAAGTVALALWIKEPKREES